CFVSTAMGTSVGTITLLTPIAIEIAAVSSFDPASCIATVIGGSMFGDNLSFISDTTIAACNGQGCEMKDKFRGNFKIALTAALATVAVVGFMTAKQIPAEISGSYQLLQMFPYALVLVGGAIGINVFVVLLAGVASGSLIMLLSGQCTFIELIGNMGSGASGMFETCMVAILVGALCELIKEHGGFDAILSVIRKLFKGPKGGQIGIGLLVGLMDIATANNTVAIVISNPIAKEISNEYGIAPQKAACLLDTFSCIFQGVIPYGAQMLVAVSCAAEMGILVSAFDIMPLLFYPFFLLISSLISIFLTAKY
ncbi:MAG: Na+/H+ antiporter NhaC family protein, partial [Erysipelotrichaceae bacterium]|nr:Na+/H+ antiporter NhaC family protein [Erysipelotrichaceae bacterium]